MQNGHNQTQQDARDMYGLSAQRCPLIRKAIEVKGFTFSIAVRLENSGEEVDVPLSKSAVRELMDMEGVSLYMIRRGLEAKEGTVKLVKEGSSYRPTIFDVEDYEGIPENLIDSTQYFRLVRGKHQL